MAFKYARFLLRYKFFVLAFTALVTLFFSWHATKVITLNALENMLPEHDPELQHYHELNRVYGGDFIMVIVLEADEIFQIFRFKASATDHSMHHKDVKVNFGLYTNVWDIVMGTYLCEDFYKNPRFFILRS